MRERARATFLDLSPSSVVAAAFHCDDVLYPRTRVMADLGLRTKHRVMRNRKTGSCIHRRRRWRMSRNISRRKRRMRKEEDEDEQQQQELERKEREEQEG